MANDDTLNIIAHNRAALESLKRALTLGSGQFSLILVRANYQRLQQIMLQSLADSLPFQIISLPATATSLRETLQASLAATPALALMVTGCENVRSLEDLFKAANLGRDTFSTTFACPVVLWGTDATFQVLNQSAADFKNFAAAPIQFEYPVSELIVALHQQSDALFDTILDGSNAQAFDHTTLLLPAVGIASQQLIGTEVSYALADLDRYQAEIDTNLQASLQFLEGREAHRQQQMTQARAAYESSLAHWQQSTDPTAIDKRAVLLLHLGLYWCSYAVSQKTENEAFYQQARQYFESCLTLFQQQDRPDRMARFIHTLAEVLRKLKDWQALTTIAEAGLTLHQGDLVRLAKDYGYLAEVSLVNEDWLQGQQYAEQALAESNQAIATLEEVLASPASSPAANTDILPEAAIIALRYHQGRYHFLLGRAKLHEENSKEALQDLENAHQQLKPNPKYDLPLYRQILKTLQDLHFSLKDYRSAFHLKIEQRQIENLFGLRAFIGASPIQPYHQTQTPCIDDINAPEALAAEIRASGRQRDVDALVNRLVQPRYPLVVIHGQSGVGKSSILKAGLMPALQQVTPEGRIVMPLLISSYLNWQNAIAEALKPRSTPTKHFSLTDPLGSPYSSPISPFISPFMEQIALPDHPLSGEIVTNIDHPDLNLPLDNLPPDDPANTLIEMLQKRTFEQYQQIVLIFDQFEEFFFERPEEQERLDFYNFLRASLNIPYIKVVLSLREDYLHYLLEWDRLTDLDIINNDILSKEVRYYLGNFKPVDAEAVIRELTQSAQYFLEDDLVKALVADLAATRGGIRPIELQVVGAELQRENITTLAQYQQLGVEPKETLVHKFLNQVVHDCGPENGNLAQAVLYLLSDDSGTRPLKTRMELEESLELAGILTSLEQLNLVLEILVGSGVVFAMLEVGGGVRYRLVHDYLADLIQQKDMPGLIEALQEERRRRKFTEDQLRQALDEQATALKEAKQDRLRAEQAEIRALVSVSQARLLSHDALEALLAAIKGACRVASTQVKYDLKVQTVFGLWQAIHSIREKNRLVGHRDWVLAACFSRDGRYIASASDDNTVIIWSRSGQLLKTLTGHDGSVLDVTFSPDSQFLASASDDRTLKLWTAEEGKLLHTFVGHEGTVNSLDFSLHNQFLVSASNDNTIKLWTLDGTLVHQIEGHSDWVRSVRFSPNGQQLLSASEDATIKRWSLSGELLKTYVGHAGWVLHAEFSPDGQIIASAGDDNTLRLWGLDGQLLRTFEGHTDWVRSLNFSPDGRCLASASDDHTIKLWDLEGYVLQTLQGHRSCVLRVAFAPEGEQLISASDDDTIRVWQITGQRPTICEGHRGIVWDACWQPQGEHLVSAGADDTLKLWNTEGRLVRTLTGHRRSVHSVAWSHDGQLLASASADQTVRLWTPSGQLIRILSGHQDDVWAVAFSPKGDYLASADTDGTVRLWRRDGTLVKVFPASAGAVWSVTFSPDGQHLLTAGEDSIVRLWQVEQGLVDVLSGHNGGVWDARFSPDGRLICSGGGDSTLRLWDLNGHEKLVMRGHRDWVRSVCFSPDGQLLVSASDDTTIRFWDTSGQLLQTLEGHTGIVWRADFDSAGERLASASADGTIRLWNLRIADLVAQGCHWLKDYLQHNQTLDENDRLICTDCTTSLQSERDH